MQDDFNIAPTKDLIRYLCLFRRALSAMQRYCQNRDQAGILLGAWIAEALDIVASMLWRHVPSDKFDNTTELADWIRVFPQAVRSKGAQDRIASDCDAIFSPEGAAAELHLHEDLNDHDLAPPERMAACFDLMHSAFLQIRWRPDVDNPWIETSDSWQMREAQTAELMGRIADVLVDLPLALAHWSEFDEPTFSERARTIWAEWPWMFGANRLKLYQRTDRLRPLWCESLPSQARGYGVGALLYWLVQQYAQPWRAYHTISHIERMFSVWKRSARSVPVTSVEAISLAIWFHDAVYDPQRSDNEEQSADEAGVHLASLGIAAAEIARIRRMILATATHHADDGDSDTELLLDLDLEILGAEPEVYDAYSRAIRQEYSFVADQEYRAGRTQVLKRFLERPRIYVTEVMFSRCEDRARQNIAREIRALEGEE